MVIHNLCESACFSDAGVTFFYITFTFKGNPVRSWAFWALCICLQLLLSWYIAAMGVWLLEVDEGHLPPHFGKGGKLVRVRFLNFSAYSLLQQGANCIILVSWLRLCTFLFLLEVFLWVQTLVSFLLVAMWTFEVFTGYASAMRFLRKILN